MAGIDSNSPPPYRRSNDDGEEEEDDDLEGYEKNIDKSGISNLKGEERRRDRPSGGTTGSRSPPRRYDRYSINSRSRSRSRSPPSSSRRRRRSSRSSSRSSSSSNEGHHHYHHHRGGRRSSRSRSPPPTKRYRKWSRSRSRSPPRSNRDYYNAPPPPGGSTGSSRADRGRPLPGYGGYPPPPHHRPEDDFHLRNLPRHPLPPGPFGDPYHGPPPHGADPFYYGPYGGPPPPGGPFPGSSRGPPLPPRWGVGPSHQQQRLPPPSAAAAARGGGGGAATNRDRGPRGRDEGPPGISLLVRNISQDITAEDLHAAFSRIGIIKDVYIPRDYHSQQPKGFAFIEFATAEQAREARDEMDRFVVKGRQLEVVFAQERRKTPNEMRGRVVDGKATTALSSTSTTKQQQGGSGKDRDKGGDKGSTNNNKDHKSAETSQKERRD